MSRLLHGVAQQHKSPRQAEYQQQHAQLLGHVPPQEATQHGTRGGEGEGELVRPGLEADSLVLN